LIFGSKRERLNIYVSWFLECRTSLNPQKIIYISKSELKENGRKSKGKSVSKIQKWTKKMSNFQKRKYFMKKG
jgi:hypothetical protein